jgi:hypothetical protein
MIIAAFAKAKEIMSKRGFQRMFEEKCSRKKMILMA